MYPLSHFIPLYPVFVYPYSIHTPPQPPHPPVLGFDYDLYLGPHLLFVSGVDERFLFCSMTVTRPGWVFQAISPGGAAPPDVLKK